MKSARIMVAKIPSPPRAADCPRRAEAEAAVIVGGGGGQFAASVIRLEHVVKMETHSFGPGHQAHGLPLEHAFGVLGFRQVEQVACPRTLMAQEIKRRVTEGSMAKGGVDTCKRHPRGY